MSTQKKLGDTRGVREWEALDTIGDVKRFIKWVVHSMRNTSLDRSDAGMFAHLANVMLRALEGAEIEKRLEALERSEELRQENSVPRANEEEPIGMRD